MRYLLLALLLPACSGSLTEAQHAGLAQRYHVDAQQIGLVPSTRCQSLDSQRTIWGAIAVSSAALAGGSGLASVPVRPGTAETGLALGAAVLGAAAAAATLIEQSRDAAWVRECSVK